MSQFSRPFFLPLAMSLAFSSAWAQSPTIPDELPLTRDLNTLSGRVFGIMAQRYTDELNNVESPEQTIDQEDPTQQAAVTDVFRPFHTLRLSSSTIALNRTRLSDLARAWGMTTAHHYPDEVAYAAACWDSKPAGLRVLMTSALSTRQFINGWLLAHEDSSTPGAPCAATAQLTAPELPYGLRLGLDRAAVLSAIHLAPIQQTSERTGWSYALNTPTQTTIQYRLYAWFADNKLVALQYHTLETN